jgi:heat shock protein HslJ
MASRLILTLLCGIGLSACAGNQIETLPKDNLWVLVDLAGVPAVEGSLLTLEIDRAGGRLIGSTGCNRYTASFAGGYESPHIGVIGMTKRACINDDLRKQERRFAELVRKIKRMATRGENVLILETVEGEMKFERTEVADR